MRPKRGIKIKYNNADKQTQAIEIIKLVLKFPLAA
jgi:hypothetical protein